MVGKIVNHAKHGQGTILNQRRKGFEFQIQFELGKKEWVRRSDLSFGEKRVDNPFILGDWVSHRSYGKGRISSIKDHGNDLEIGVQFGDAYRELLQSLAKLKKCLPQKNKIVIPETPFIDNNHQDKTFQARHNIEALRYGIVPSEFVEEITVGRESEAEKIKKFINDEKKSGLVIVGDYGSGKSHLLHYIANRAIHDGLAVAHVSIDTKESPFYKPKRIYSKLINSFHFPNRNSLRHENIDELFKEAYSAGFLKEHPYFELLENVSDPQLIKWIRAKESISRPAISTEDSEFKDYHHLFPLYDFSNTSNIYCYLLSGLGWITRRLGLKGLILIFDEAESVDKAHYSHQSRNSLNFVEALCRMSLNDPLLLEHPSLTGMEHCHQGGAEDLPFLFRPPCSTKIVLTFTEWTVFNLIPVLRKFDLIELKNIPENLIDELLISIAKLYSKAYGISNNAKFRKDSLLLVKERLKNMSGGSRRFVKCCVEAMDIVRLKLETHKING